MVHPSNGLLRLIPAILLLASPALAQRDEDALDRYAHLGRWIPALSMEGGVVGEDMRGKVRSDRDPLLREPASGSTRTVYATLGGRFQLSTPALFDTGHRELERRMGLRLFAHVGLSHSLDKQNNAARSGTTGQFRLGGDPVDLDDPTLIFALVGGQGLATRVEAEPLLISAGFGLDFVIEVMDRLVHIKPSLEYRRQDLHVETFISDIIADGTNPSQTAFCPCDSIRLEGSKNEQFDGLGPGLELEVEAASLGQSLFSFYVRSVVYHNLGDRNVDVSATGTYEGTTGETATVEGQLRVPEWGLLVAAGIRLSWTGSAW